jgi:hypothetical protein
MAFRIAKARLRRYMTERHDPARLGGVVDYGVHVSDDHRKHYAGDVFAEVLGGLEMGDHRAGNHQPVDLLGMQHRVADRQPAAERKPTGLA